MANNKLSTCLVLEIYPTFPTLKKEKTLKTTEINACFKFNNVINTRIELKPDHITSTG